MELIVNLLWSVESILFLWGIVRMRFSKSKVRIGIGLAIIVLSKIFATYFDYSVSSLMFGKLIGTALGTLIIFDGNFVRNISKYCFVFSYAEFIYLPINFLLFILTSVMKLNIVSVAEDIIKSLIAIGIIFGISCLIKSRKSVVEWIIELPAIYFWLAFVCAFTVSGISSYSGYIMEDADMKVRILFESLRILLSVFIYILGIAFAVVDYLRKIYKYENKMKDQYLQMAKAHYESLVSYMQEVRKLKHDMQGHINVLNIYAADGKWELLGKYLEKLTESHMAKGYKIAGTNNQLVDAIISDVAGKNEQNSIIIECEGKFPSDIIVSDFDLCTIFSNLLSNAVEACGKLVNSEKKIHIDIESTSDKIRIEFENPIEWEIDMDRLGSYTSKHDKENHGFGVRNIRDTVEKYEGNMVMTVENNIFKTVIIFYM